MVPVLIVDDNSAKRLALKAVLLPLGYSITEAESGQAALRCLLAQDFAVILLDVRMPVMDGFETAALIRLRPRSEMTPIIFITAYGRSEIQDVDRYSEGAVDFMFAPVPPDELRAKVSVFGNIFLRAQALAARAQEVQTSADQLRVLTDAAPIGIFQTDADNNYTYTNPCWTEITGISSSEAAGRPWHTIIDREQLAHLLAELPSGAANRQDLCHRFEVRPPGMAPRIVLIRTTSVPDSHGGAAGWVGTVADVTAEVGAQAAMSDAHAELEGLNVELTAIARRDPLTGLGNRLALDEDLELLEARAARYGYRYCVAVLDVDHFKSYNDTYGHQAGDRSLQVVADQIRAQSRAGDALYRYGGDEFLCVLPEQSLQLGIAAVERMRSAVEGLAIPHGDNPGGALTLSGGVAVLGCDSGRSAATVLKEADDALYRAKQLGRNRVEHLAVQPA